LHRDVESNAAGTDHICDDPDAGGAIEDRTGDLPYLLAGLRLSRLEDPVRRSDAQRRVARIRQLRGR
jgi:hypothetical protein